MSEINVLDKIVEIFNSYELKPIVLDEKYNNVYQYLNEFPDKRPEYESEKDDTYFIEKYKNRIPKGHYGFAIGSPIIPVWCDILENIIDTCIEDDPNFKILQIKIKFGGIRFYVNTTIKQIDGIELLIMSILHDNALIY